jgi:hypothetical protein
VKQARGRMAQRTIIAETHHGFVCAHAGVDIERRWEDRGLIAGRRGCFGAPTDRTFASAPAWSWQ